MPVDLIHLANVRDQRLIEIGGIVDQGGRYSSVGNALYIVTVEAKKALASGQRESIIRNCYIANTQRQAVSPSTRQGTNPLMLPPVLVPRGTIYMCSEHGTRMRMKGGHVVLVYGFTAAEMLAIGSHRVATKEEVEQYKEERRRSVEEIRVKDIDLHPEKQTPVIHLQSPEGYSQIVNGGLRPDQVVISRADLASMIARGVEEYINKATGATSPPSPAAPAAPSEHENVDGPLGAPGPITDLAAGSNKSTSTVSSVNGVNGTTHEDGVGGPTYDDADDSAVSSGNTNLTSPPKMPQGSGSSSRKSYR